MKSIQRKKSLSNNNLNKFIFIIKLKFYSIINSKKLIIKLLYLANDVNLIMNLHFFF